MNHLNDTDRQWLIQAMGRELKGEFTIARRTHEGRPQVLRVPPIVEGRPFPSLYWLCCPQLKKEIDHLEARGLIKELEQRIPHDSTLRVALVQDHKRYQQERNELLEAQLKTLQKEHYPTESMLKDLSIKGIGGLEDWSRIRCLHMHYAYHLIAPTYLGNLLDQEFKLATWA